MKKLKILRFRNEQRHMMKVGVIGAGVMGSAFIRGLLKQGVVEPRDVCASDIDHEKLERLERETGVRTFRDNASVAREADVLLVCVKPQQLPDMLDSLREHISKHHVVISIAAGVRIKTIEEHLPEDARVIRAMPNQACLVGLSATAFTLGRNATKEDRLIADKIFSSIGRVYLVDEEMLDAVTGLSGSGPAYAYMVIDAMAEGGVEAGLPWEISVALAAQTLLGAATMVLETKKNPEELKALVATPGGTTVAGIRALEEGGLKKALVNAVIEATKRSKELSSQRK